MCAGRASSPIRTSGSRILAAATARAYSTDAEGKPHKLWDFEAVRHPTLGYNVMKKA